MSMPFQIVDEGARMLAYTQTIIMNLKNNKIYSQPSTVTLSANATISTSTSQHPEKSPDASPGNDLKTMKWVQVDPSESQGDWRFRNSGIMLTASGNNSTTAASTGTLDVVHGSGGSMPTAITASGPRDGNRHMYMPATGAEKGSFIDFSLDIQTEATTVKPTVPVKRKYKERRMVVRAPALVNSNSNVNRNTNNSKSKSTYSYTSTSTRSPPRRNLNAGNPQRFVPAHRPSIPPHTRSSNTQHTTPMRGYCYQSAYPRVINRYTRPQGLEMLVNYRARPPVVLQIPRLVVPQRLPPPRPGSTGYSIRQGGGVLYPASLRRRLSVMDNISPAEQPSVKQSLIIKPHDNRYRLAPVDWSKVMPSFYGARSVTSGSDTQDSNTPSTRTSTVDDSDDDMLIYAESSNAEAPPMTPEGLTEPEDEVDVVQARSFWDVVDFK